MDKTIGLRIREFRKIRHMSADELANRIGKDRSTVFRYENGEIDNMSFEILMSIADVLDVKPETILGWEIKTQSDVESEAHLFKYAEMLHNLRLTDDETEQVIKYAEFIKKSK